MTSNARGSNRILGSLRSADGAGAVHIEERFDTDIDDMWAAITDPSRLARWYGKVDGDLRLGGEYSAYVYASGWEGTGRVEVCEPPRRLVLMSREPDQAFEEVIEATLTAEGDQTVLVLDVRGMPLDKIHFYGAGWQIHVEDLGAHIAGRERESRDDERWDELVPPYEELAAKID